MKHAHEARREYDTNVLEGEESQARWIKELSGQISEALAADPPKNSILVEAPALPTEVYKTVIELQYRITEESYIEQVFDYTDATGCPRNRPEKHRGLRISW